MSKNTIVKIIFSLIILLNINNALFGQTQEKNQSTIHIESGDGENIQSCEGYFFLADLTKNKVSYTAILANKNVINNTGEIKLFFNPKSGEQPNKTNSFVVTVPIKPHQTIQDNNNDLVIIPIYILYQLLDNKKLITDQIFLTEDTLLEFNPKIKESDFSKLISRWNWEINEAYKKRD